MEKEKEYTYAEYIAEYIAERLSDRLGDTFESAYELADAITEHDNASGSFTYSTYEAKRLLGAWWEAVADFVEEYQNEYGDEPQHNPFKSPELFHGLMVIIGAEKMLSKVLDALKVAEPFELTEELAEAIKRELEKEAKR